MVYQCHKCKKEFIQRTDFRRHLNRKIDCLNIPLEDRVAAKVLNVLKTELTNDNIIDRDNMNIAIPEIYPMTVANGAAIAAAQQENLEVLLEDPESLEELIRHEQWAEMTLVKVQAKMKEHDIPDLLYASGKNKGKIHKNRNRTVAHCLKWARSNEKKEETKEETKKDEPVEIKSGSIFSKMSSEDLKELIHDIHNFLRNNGIGYGMSALKIFNLLYGLKKIEKFDLFDKIELDRKCAFSSLVKLAKDGENICQVFDRECLEHLHDSIIQNFLMEELPDHIKEKDLRHLVLEINNLVELEYSTEEQLSGKIYEYFIGRDESAISELGAYFTNRLIVNYIYNLVDPQLGPNGEVQTMIDPFGGSGGFTGGYIEHLQKQNPNWETGLSNVFHIDMNNDVVKYAGMEFMCLTQEVPEMGKNLRCENSFTFEFDPEKLFKFIFTNPPYGGDKNSKYGKRLENDKLLNHLKALVKPINALVDNNKKAAKNPKKYKHVDIPKEQLLLKARYDKQNKQCLAVERKYTKKFEASKVSLANSSNFIRRYAHKHKLTSNDKEGVSLILMMALLAPGGTAVGVLKEGVFFNATYKDLREHLLTHFNVLKVISVPQDQFENTSTKTSIVIFERPEIPFEPEVKLEDAAKQSLKPRTTQVEFRKLNVLKYTEDKFEWNDATNTMSLIESAGEVYGLDDPVIANATFKEIKAKNWCLDGKKYNVKKLIPGEGFKMVKLGDVADVKYGTRIVKSNNTVGDIPVYGGGNITFYTNKHNRDNGTLVVSRYALSKECVRIVAGQFYLNDSGMSLHCKSGFTQGYLNYYMISPNTQHLILNGYTRGSIQRNVDVKAFKQFQIPVPIDPEVTAAWVNGISAPYNLARQMETQLKRLEQEVSDEILRITEEELCDEFKLGDLCDINPKNIARFDTSHGKTSGKYRFHTGAAGGSYLFVNDCNIEKEVIVINKTNGSGKCNVFIDKNVSCAKQTYIVLSKDEKPIQLKYVYYLFLGKIPDLEKGYVGACHKNLQMSYLEQFPIKIPKDKTLIEALEVKFQQIEQCRETLRNAEEQFKLQVDELGKAALKDNGSDAPKE